MNQPARIPDTGIGTYKTVLADWCRAVNPQRILEWGPGPSTALMHRLCPTAEILTIEHDKKWASKAEAEHGAYARVVHTPIKPSNRYCVWPLMEDPSKTYDLIFIDGRQRVACLKVARQLLSPRGVIVLHDAQRPEYSVAFDDMEVVDFRDATAALRPRPPVASAISDLLPAITCVCPTYGRFQKVRVALSSFLGQTYPNKTLLILNDAETPLVLAEPYPHVQVVNIAKRFPTMGAKRNFMLDLCQTPLLIHWDDDDTYMPWHLAQSVLALTASSWAATPQEVWYVVGEGDDMAIERLWHFTHDGCVLWRAAALRDMGGYFQIHRGQTWSLMKRVQRQGHLAWFDVKPFIGYLYRAQRSGTHLSGKGITAKSYDAGNQDFGNGEPLSPGDLRPYWALLERDARDKMPEPQYKALMALCQTYHPQGD